MLPELRHFLFQEGAAEGDLVLFELLFSHEMGKNHGRFVSRLVPRGNQDLEPPFGGRGRDGEIGDVAGFALDGVGVTLEKAIPNQDARAGHFLRKPVQGDPGPPGIDVVGGTDHADLRRHRVDGRFHHERCPVFQPGMILGRDGDRRRAIFKIQFAWVQLGTQRLLPSYPRRRFRTEQPDPCLPD